MTSWGHQVRRPSSCLDTGADRLRHCRHLGGPPRQRHGHCAFPFAGEATNSIYGRPLPRSLPIPADRVAF